MQVDAFLGSIGVEDKTIKAIMSILDENAEAFRHGAPGAVPGAAFGGSDAGGQLGHHTSLAHQHVVEAMKEMAAGMTGYRINIGKFHSDVTFTDEDAASVLTGIQNTTVCAAGNDFSATAQTTSCQVESVATTGGV